MNTFPSFSLPSVVIAASLVLSGCQQDSVQSSSPLSVRPVNVMQLQAHDQLQTQRFSGVVRSQHTSNLSFRVQGTVAEILVDEGDSVKKGQVLARLDPHDFQVDVNRIQAQLNEAQAAYKLSKIERKRTQQATSDNAIAHINLDRALSAETRAAANVDLLQQSLVKAQDALKYSQLVAPFDGVVAKRFIDNHEQTLPSQKIMTIHQPDKLEVVANVPERKLHLIQENSHGQVQWFGMHEQVEANVTKIATIPDPLTRTYDVTFALSSLPQQLFSGKAVNVELTSSLDNASQPTFCLPAMAVSHQGNRTHVVQSVQDKAHYVDVNVVSGQDDQLCVQGDLALGNTIVTAGSAYLKEGDQVKALNEVES